jgi:hypothetical protein
MNLLLTWNASNHIPQKTILSQNATIDTKLCLKAVSIPHAPDELERKSIIIELSFARELGLQLIKIIFFEK